MEFNYETIKNLDKGNYMITLVNEDKHEFLRLHIDTEIYVSCPGLEVSKVVLLPECLGIFIPVGTLLFSGYGLVRIPYQFIKFIASIKTFDEFMIENQNKVIKD